MPLTTRQVPIYIDETSTITVCKIFKVNAKHGIKYAYRGMQISIYTFFFEREEKKNQFTWLKGEYKKKSLFAERVTISGVSFTAIKLKIKS